MDHLVYPLVSLRHIRNFLRKVRLKVGLYEENSECDAGYPLVSYCGINFTPLRRIGVGMLFASASVIVAGVVEIDMEEIHGLMAGFVCSVHVNVLCQIPQFMLVGSSEVLTVIRDMQSLYFSK